MKGKMGNFDAIDIARVGSLLQKISDCKDIGLLPDYAEDLFTILFMEQKTNTEENK